MRYHERIVMLSVLDGLWKDHLLAMDHLKEGIGLRGYAQQDPLVAYKKESFEMFEAMMLRFQEDTARHLFRMQIIGPDGQPIETPEQLPQRSPLHRRLRSRRRSWSERLSPRFRRSPRILRSFPRGSPQPPSMPSNASSRRRRSANWSGRGSPEARKPRLRDRGGLEKKSAATTSARAGPARSTRIATASRLSFLRCGADCRFHPPPRQNASKYST